MPSPGLSGALRERYGPARILNPLKRDEPGVDVKFFAAQASHAARTYGPDSPEARRAGIMYARALTRSPQDLKVQFRAAQARARLSGAR